MYALIVLLEAIAGSLWLVRTAAAQESSWTARRGTGSAILYAWPLSDSLDGDCTDECMAPGRANGQVEDVPSGSAAAIGEECNGDSFPIFTFSGPATSLKYVSLDGCGGIAGCGALVAERGEAEGWVEAPASLAETSLSAGEAREACRALRIATARAGDIARRVWNERWSACLSLVSSVEDEAQASEGEGLTVDDARGAWSSLNVASQRVSDLAVVSWNAVWAPCRQNWLWTHQAVPAEVFSLVNVIRVELPGQVIRYRQEAILIQAANTLEQVGAQLQQAAQQLRSGAVQRIGAKDDSRHVALRSN
jgi:hypothetical protein